MDGHIKIYGPIGEIEGEQGITLLDIIMQVHAQPIASRYIVHFNSPGGNVEEAELIQNYLAKLAETSEVIALGEGLVASAASKIFLSVNNRAALDSFELMMHNPWGGIEGEAGDIEWYADRMRKLEKEYESYYSERLNIDSETISSLMDKETYLTLEQCKSLKIINFQLNQQPAIVMLAKKESQMDKETKSWLEQKLDAIAQALKPKIEAPKAVVIMSKEGVELNFPGEAPEVGAKVDAPDGTYNIDYAEKAWVLVVTGGVVESLEEVQDDPPAGDPEVEALKAENESLKKQLQDFSAIKAKVEEMTAYVEKHKAMQSKHEPDGQSKEKFTNPDQKIESGIKALLEERREAAKQRKQKFTTKR